MRLWRGMRLLSQTILALWVGGCASRPPIVEEPTTFVPAEVLVHVDSNQSVVLARVATTGVPTEPHKPVDPRAKGYEYVCADPCNMKVPINQQYVFLGVSGNTGGESDPFVLPPRDRVTLRVDSGSQGWWGFGWGSTVVGIGALTGGLPLWLMGGNDVNTVGEVMTLASVPLLVFGIWSIVANHTNVTTETGQDLAVRPGMRATPGGLAWRF